MRAIFSQILQEQKSGGDVVLVTLIGDRGSAPRRSGSQMLVGRSGRLAGTVGGGEVERRSEELAGKLLREGGSCVREFPLHLGSPESIGMVCGGEVTAHFQFLAAADPVWGAAAAAVKACLDAHRKGWLVLREDGGEPSLLDGEGALLAGAEIGGAEERNALCGRRLVRENGRFSLPLPVGERAILFGAGHISQALCPLLRSVDFRPVVMDCRPEYAVREAFPDAEDVLCGDFAHLSDTLTIAPEDFLVVLTSGHSHDFEVQEQVLRGPFAYLGVIGSRAKTAAVNRMLLEAGVPEMRLQEIHTPVGLAIKAVTPAEIAVSIAGEMILVRALARESGERA